MSKVNQVSLAADLNTIIFAYRVKDKSFWVMYEADPLIQRWNVKVLQETTFKQSICVYTTVAGIHPTVNHAIGILTEALQYLATIKN